MNDPASPVATAPEAPSVQDRFPTAYTILFALIILMAVLTWILPAGQYQRAANEASDSGSAYTDGGAVSATPANAPGDIPSNCSARGLAITMAPS